MQDSQKVNKKGKGANNSSSELCEYKAPESFVKILHHLKQANRLILQYNHPEFNDLIRDKVLEVEVLTNDAAIVVSDMVSVLFTEECYR